jgi:hypothetical protein
VKPVHGWLQLSLRSLLLVLTICAVWLGWQMYRKRQLQGQQKAAAAAVKALCGEAQRSLSSRSPIAVALERNDAENIFFLPDKQISDDDLRLLESAPMTRGLYLSHNKITDQGLAHLK